MEPADSISACLIFIEVDGVPIFRDTPQQRGAHPLLPPFFHLGATIEIQDILILRMIQSPSDSRPSYWLRSSGIKNMGGWPSISCLLE